MHLEWKIQFKEQFFSIFFEIKDIIMFIGKRLKILEQINVRV